MTDAERLAALRNRNWALWSMGDQQWLLTQLDDVLVSLYCFCHDHDCDYAENGGHANNCRRCIAAEQLARLMGEEKS
jgi:hypothetical protein